MKTEYTLTEGELEKIIFGKDEDEQNHHRSRKKWQKNPDESSDNLPDNAYTEGSILEFQEEAKVEDVEFTRMATKK